MDIDKEAVGRRIKNVRISHGKTMKDFGKLFDPIASDSIVSRWERGISVPNNERLKRIAEIGNISLNELLYGFKPMKKNLYEDTKVLLEEKLSKYISEMREFYSNEEIVEFKSMVYKYFETKYGNLSSIKISKTDIQSNDNSKYLSYLNERITQRTILATDLESFFDIHRNLKNGNSNILNYLNRRIYFNKYIFSNYKEFLDISNFPYNEKLFKELNDMLEDTNERTKKLFEEYNIEISDI